MRILAYYTKIVKFYNQILSKNCFIVNDIENFNFRLNLIYNSKKLYKLDSNSPLDPFVDGKALKRIYFYINMIEKINGSKKEKIYKANAKYKKLYGNDKIYLKSSRG